MEYKLLNVVFGKGRVADFIKSVKDGKNTIYDELGYPREEAQMVKFIREYKENAVSQRDSTESTDPNRSKNYIDKFLTDALKKYDEDGNFHDLLNVFITIDLQVKIAEARKKGLSEEEFKAYKDKLYLYGSVLKDPVSKEVYDNTIDSFTKREAIDRLSKIHVESVYGREALAPRLDEKTSKADWSVQLFPKKQLYFEADAVYADMPQLNQNVKVYSHGIFKFGSMARPDGEHAVTDELSEIISVERTNSLGEKIRDFLIVGDRILGRVEYLSAQQIYDMQARGTKMLVASDAKEEEELTRLRHSLITLHKAIKVHEGRAKVSKFTAKIAKPLSKMGIVDIVEGKNEFEKQEERKEREKDIIARIDALRVKKELARPCFISDPQRIRLSQDQQETLARNIFVAPVIYKAISENGRFIGNMDTRSSKFLLDPRRINSQTRNACRYAESHPGLVNGRETMTLSQLIVELQRKEELEDSRGVNSSNDAETR